MADLGIVAPVIDGKLEYGSTESTSSSTSTEATSGSSLGKDEFLQLLVAQMKYQDPLQPMDNSEYVAQLATFSQLEETQNMQAAIQQQEANALIGKQVIIETTNASGQKTQISGYVDYTIMQSNKVYVSVNGNLYNMDDLYSVLDEDYLDASSIASSFSSLISAMPKVEELTLEQEETLSAIRTAYDSLSSYQKSFINEEDVTALEALEAQMKVLKEAAGTTEGTEETEGTDSTEGSESEDTTTA